MKRIYLDTNIWDQLCDRKVDPKQFIEVLASKGYTLVISISGRSTHAAVPIAAWFYWR